MNNKKGVVFLTHIRNTKFENKNIEIVRQLNPEWEVIPLGFSGYNLLPNSLIAERRNYPSNYELSQLHNYNSDWLSADILFCEGYRLKPNYDKYFFYEYDTISNVSIKNFFNLSLNCFCVDNKFPVEREWNWVEDYLKINNNSSIKFGAAGQTTCMFFTNKVLENYRDILISNPGGIYNNMVSELRLGTILGNEGLLNKSRADIDNFISYDVNHLNIDLNKDFFYHPVKEFPLNYIDNLKKYNNINI